jgi:hypothetical protein
LGAHQTLPIHHIVPTNIHIPTYLGIRHLAHQPAADAPNGGAHPEEGDEERGLLDGEALLLLLLFFFKLFVFGVFDGDVVYVLTQRG